jgi:hypothetical protein
VYCLNPRNVGLSWGMTSGSRWLLRISPLRTSYDLMTLGYPRCWRSIDWHRCHTCSLLVVFQKGRLSWWLKPAASRLFKAISTVILSLTLREPEDATCVDVVVEGISITDPEIARRCHVCGHSGRKHIHSITGRHLRREEVNDPQNLSLSFVFYCIL